MKKFCLFLVLSLFCLQSEGQILAGYSAVGIRVDTLNYQHSSNITNIITLTDSLFFSCNLLPSISIYISNNIVYVQGLGHRGTANVVVRSIDSTIEIAGFQDLLTNNSMLPPSSVFSVVKLPIGRLISDTSNFSWFYGATINLSIYFASLNSSWLSFNNKYIPIRKKYGNDYLYGWLYASSNAHHVNIYQATIFPKSLTVIKDTLTCNSSYTFADGFVMNNIYQDTMYDFALPSSTIGCDSLVRTKLHVNFQNFVTHYDTVCIGTNYTFLDGSSQVVTSNPIIHHNVFTNINGCDSIIKTVLNVRGKYSYDTVKITCNQNYTFPDSVTFYNILADSSHVSYFTNINGCDSIITTKIIMKAIQTETNVNLCKGGNYTFPDGTTLLDIKNSTSHTSHFVTPKGCDSMSIINLQIFTNQQDINVDVCRGESYVYPDSSMVKNIQQNSSHISYFKSIDGCDSLIRTILNVLPSYNYANLANLCPGSNYTFLDSFTLNNIIKDTIYINRFKTKLGCDSLVSTYISIYPLDYTIKRIGDTLYAAKNLPYYQWINCSTKEVLKKKNTYKLEVYSVGSYAVILENTNYCQDTSECFFVNSISSNSFYYFDIYPNPTSSKITILVLNEEAFNTKRELFNSLGQLIISTKENEMDVSYLPKGVYFLKIANQAKKVLVE